MRFAPSPTGALHVGSARTTLFNWLYARATHGTFVLRIEDTDRNRSTKESEEQILEGLRWLGLTWDEGPDIGGPYAPYRQTERQAAGVYRPYLEKLLQSGQAYHCYCTPEDLARDREKMLAAKKAPVYAGRCCNLTQAERDAHVAGGRAPVVRFKVRREEIRFKDIVRGEVRMHGDDFGDFVIAKSDGDPLYVFANVVDDALMKITHVIRGEEHLPNTPKQLLLYEALGLTSPQFAHLPLILNPDRSKMSKRAGPTHIFEYRDEGYLPDALINYLALLGWNPGTTQEVFSREELITAFSLDKLTKSGAVFDLTRLQWMDGQHLRKLSEQQLLDVAQKFLPPTAKRASADVIVRAVATVQERVRYLGELPELTGFYFALPAYEPALLVWKKSTPARTLDVLSKVQTAIESWPDNVWRERQSLTEALKKFTDGAGLTTGDVFWPVRVALSGLKASPGPQDVMWVLGPAETATRLKNAITRLAPTV